MSKKKGNIFQRIGHSLKVDATNLVHGTTGSKLLDADAHLISDIVKVPTLGLTAADGLVKGVGSTLGGLGGKTATPSSQLAVNAPQSNSAQDMLIVGVICVGLFFVLKWLKVF